MFDVRVGPGSLEGEGIGHGLDEPAGKAMRSVRDRLVVQRAPGVWRRADLDGGVIT